MLNGNEWHSAPKDIIINVLFYTTNLVVISNFNVLRKYK